MTKEKTIPDKIMVTIEKYDMTGGEILEKEILTEAEVQSIVFFCKDERLQAKLRKFT